VGYAKPDSRFFDRVFSDHPKLKRTQTMIVGDSLSGDIKGGMNAGIRTCWINRNGDDRPTDMNIDLELDDITKLEKEL
jgi:FMN phosphatase YigB (HAD superfamily)